MSQNSSTSNQTSAIKKQFSFPWKIEWSNFQDLPTKIIENHFNTPYNNVVFYWKFKLSTDEEHTKADKFGFYLFYLDGPVTKIPDWECTVSILKTDKAMEFLNPVNNELTRGSGLGWHDFDDRDMKKFQEKYDLVDSKYFTFQITLKISLSAFTDAQCFGYELESQVGMKSCTCNAMDKAWISKLFLCIDAPEESEESSYWDCKLKSRDDVIFYCHRVFLGHQSKPLAAMFRNPPSKNVHEAEFPFPSLSSEMLKALLEYLYTKRVELNNLSTTNVIEIGDAAEQYELKELKKLCTAVLWDRAVEEPEDCFDIIQFTDLHPDMKYVKHRALDVVAENYEKLGLASEDLAIRFGGSDQGNRLKFEFNLFFCRRLTPKFDEK